MEDFYENANGKKKNSAIYKLITFRKSKSFYCITCTVFLIFSFLFVRGFFKYLENTEDSQFYTFSAIDINGNWKSFRQFKHHVILIVNLASNCSLTQTNYSSLQKVYERFRNKGFTIIGFPSNQFNQETGSNEDIREFTKKMGITFPVMQKIEVNGRFEHPVFSFIKYYLPGDVQWNFEKFFINKHGLPVSRYSSETSPYTLESEIARLLYTA